MNRFCLASPWFPFCPSPQNGHPQRLPTGRLVAGAAALAELEADRRGLSSPALRFHVKRADARDAGNENWNDPDKPSFVIGLLCFPLRGTPRNYPPVTCPQPQTYHLDREAECLDDAISMVASLIAESGAQRCLQRRALQLLRVDDLQAVEAPFRSLNQRALSKGREEGCVHWSVGYNPPLRKKSPTNQGFKTPQEQVSVITSDGVGVHVKKSQRAAGSCFARQVPVLVQMLQPLGRNGISECGPPPKCRSLQNTAKSVLRKDGAPHLKTTPTTGTLPCLSKVLSTAYILLVGPR